GGTRTEVGSCLQVTVHFRAGRARPLRPSLQLRAGQQIPAAIGAPRQLPEVRRAWLLIGQEGISLALAFPPVRSNQAPAAWTAPRAGSARPVLPDILRCTWQGRSRRVRCIRSKLLQPRNS